MKNLYLVALVFLTSFISFAQAPELMSYQALVRDSNDQLIQNSPVGLRISILLNSDTGSAVYTETHTVNTNENGLVTLSIGSGTTSDDFSSIDWGDGTYYIKSETDPSGGSNYTIEGTSQLLSVPYALYAKNSGNSDGNGSNEPNPVNDFNSNFLVADFSTVYAYNGATGTWSSQSTNTVEEGDIVGSNGNFVIADFSTIYAYNGATGTWSSQSTNTVEEGRHCWVKWQFCNC